MVGKQSSLIGKQLAVVLGAVFLSAWLTNHPLAQSDLPDIAQQALQSSIRECGSRYRLLPGFISRKDINEDGRVDFILDYGAFECDASGGFYCGTGGCVAQVYASLPTGGYAEVLNQNVRELRFARVRNRPAMILSLHGSECGRPGYQTCNVTLYWNGFSFSAAN